VADAPLTTEVPIADLRPYPSNARRTYNPVTLAEFADNIQRWGLLQPLLVRPARATWEVVPGLGKDAESGKRVSGWFVCDLSLLVAAGESPGTYPVEDPPFFRDEEAARRSLPRPTAYEIVFGHRRWKAGLLIAARLPRFRTLRCQIAELSDEEVAVLQISENDQREDLLPTEKVTAYRRLATQHGYSARMIAEQVGRSVGYVQTVLAVGRCPESMLEALDAGRITLSVAREVARIAEPEGRERAAKCVLEGCTDPANAGWLPAPEPLTHRQTEELIRGHFQRELKSAPFDSEDASLPGGSCTTCPKRAGNAGELYAGVRGDTCLDPACFARKAEAARRVRTPPPVVEADEATIARQKRTVRVLTASVEADGLSVDVSADADEPTVSRAVRKALAGRLQFTWE
jgi:ParB/RepB/Spo0J family partition protein